MVSNRLLSVIKRLHDIFPRAGMSIGGSTARNTIEGFPIGISSDVDIYLNASVCRYSFVRIVGEIMFADVEVNFPTEVGETPGDPGYYKMPHMRRRVTAIFPNGEYPSFDFIFLNPEEVPDVPKFLLEHQASTISECALELKFGIGTKAKLGYKIHKSEDYTKAMLGKKTVVLNNHQDVCTAAQAAKVLQFCGEHELDIQVIHKEKV